MSREIDRKENVIVHQIAYTKSWKSLNDSCEAENKNKATIIERQSLTIGRISTVKRFSFGPAIGYGITLPWTTPGFTVGIMFTYSLIRF
jgi:hypothetical protein